MHVGVSGDVLGEEVSADAGGAGMDAAMFAGLDSAEDSAPLRRAVAAVPPQSASASTSSAVRYIAPGAAGATSSIPGRGIDVAIVTPSRKHSHSAAVEAAAAAAAADAESEGPDSEDDGVGVATSPDGSAAGSAHFSSGFAGEADVPGGARAPARPLSTYMDDMRSFLRDPLPYAAGSVACYIERGKVGLFGGAPTYSLYTKEGDRFLLAARKRSGKRTSNYIVSSDRGDLSREGSGFLGKLRGNFVGTEYVVYDDGEAPGARKGSGSVRKELAVVAYQSNVMGTRGPRKMQVSVPRVDAADNSRVVFQPAEGEPTMADLIKAGHTQDMVTMVNKPPKWNEAVKAFVLNFNGRVTMASVKNFQLVTPTDHERVVLQFGRVGKDLFTMDVMWPLSPLQAFSICLSSFDYKLACE